MIIREHRRRNLTVSILSLSLLTVMAGAAVAPALNTIKAYFSDVNQTVTQMIISMPRPVHRHHESHFSQALRPLQIKSAADDRAAFICCRRKYGRNI